MKDLLECVHESLPDFQPREDVFYEFSYMFERLVDDKVVRSFSHLVARWSGHEERFALMRSDDEILSCLVEYLHEYDCSFIARVFVLKNKEEK